MIIRTDTQRCDPMRWGRTLSGAEIMAARRVVRDQLAQVGAPTLTAGIGGHLAERAGHVRYVWEVLENSGLTELSGGTRRLWDPYSPVPPKTIEITVIGIWTDRLEVPA